MSVSVLLLLLKWWKGTGFLFLFRLEVVGVGVVGVVGVVDVVVVVAVVEMVETDGVSLKILLQVVGANVVGVVGVVDVVVVEMVETDGAWTGLTRRFTSLGFPRFYWVLLGFTGFCWVQVELKTFF